MNRRTGKRIQGGKPVHVTFLEGVKRVNYDLFLVLNSRISFGVVHLLLSQKSEL